MALVFGAIVACAAPSSDGAVETRDSSGVLITDIRVQPGFLPEWSLGQERLVLTGAETGDSGAFAFVGSVSWLAGGGLVIADVAASRLLVYDASGRFVRSLGRRGAGPGELQRLESIAVLGDTIATFDASLRRLSVWHPESGFVRSVSLADGGSLESFPLNAFPWRDSLIVVFQFATTPLEAVPPGTGIRRWPTRAHFTLRDSAGRVLETSPTFDGSYSGLFDQGDLRLPFANRPFAAAGRNRLYFGSGDSFEIAYLDSTFARAGVIRWSNRNERLTSEEVEKVRGEAIATISARPLPATPFARQFAPEILPANRPSIGRVFIDGDENLWVERFEAARMGGPQMPGDQWSILTGDGRPLAILRLPPLTRLEDARGDEVVVVRRDSLDVQTVAVHRLRR
jgi:hypothetical protein